jgi:thiosulfate dehydrogenase
MKRIGLISLLVLSAGILMVTRGLSAVESFKIDLTRWTAPDIATVGDDPFETLVKYGHALFADTANEIGPMVSDRTKRFAGNNLACENCHLQGGRRPYAMSVAKR